MASRLEAIVTSGGAAHAYLLLGPRGAGKEILAQKLAIGLACVKPERGLACGDCQSCALAARSIHPDILTLDYTPDTSHGIDDVRSILQRLSHAPSHGRRRVCIIKRADELTEEASNALLKTLEEPTGETVILLTAVHITAVPLTVISRCAVIIVSLPTVEQLKAKLIAAGRTALAAGKIAALSEGRTAYAEFLAEHPDAADRALADGEILTTALQAPIHQRIKMAEELSDYFGDHDEDVLERWESVGRGLLKEAVGLPDRSAWHDQLRSISSRLNQRQAHAILQAVIDARRTLRVSSNPRLTLESFFLHLPQP